MNTIVGHSIPVRIYYEDTDAGGVVYYAAYLRFMERVRSEWLRSLGFDVQRLAAEEGILFAVRALQVDYLRPARLSDQLDVSVALQHCGRASLVVDQQVQRDGIGVLLAASYFSSRQIDLIVERTGCRIVQVPLGPPEVTAEGYFELVDDWVEQLAMAAGS